MVIGFIGTGGITEAIVTGLYNCGGHREKILISRRSQSRSRKLAESFSKIQVIDDNQAIVDRSAWVFISVLPEQTLAVLSSLRFRADHRIISLAAGVELSTLAEHVQPAANVCRAIPMPPIEFGLGPTPVCPPDQQVQALFDRVGTAVAVDDERNFAALAASSAVMATFFEWVASNAAWLESEDVPAQQAALYTTSVFHALATLTTKVDAAGLKRMSTECLTPGGLNEQVLKGVQKERVIQRIQAQIGAVMDRLERQGRVNQS